jgi:hypothetical protein
VVEPSGENLERRQEGRRLRRGLALDDVPVAPFRRQLEGAQGQKPEMPLIRVEVVKEG